MSLTIWDVDVALSDNPLGKPTDYTDTYTPSLLFAIERSAARSVVGVPDVLPFTGEDVWMGYELSWLNQAGKPQVAALQLNVPCASPCIVESKSLKLYLNSFAMTRFTNKVDVLNTLNSDLTIAFRAPVIVQLLEVGQIPRAVEQLPGTCLDGLEVAVDEYALAPSVLEVEDGEERRVKETLHTNLFRSLCPVTSQPDFATVVIEYLGRPIVRESLLEYLISFRCHKAYHETTVEQIFMDLLVHCHPEQLSVSAHFLRRGGIDICPYRSNSEDRAPQIRLPRQ